MLHQNPTHSSASICLGAPSSCCPLRLTTCLPDHYAQSNRAGFDCCYTFIFTPQLYFLPPSCFPNTQKTLLIKVIPQCCYSVGMRQRHADCQVKQDLETILMVCLSWWSNVTSRPFHAGESLILGTWVFSQAKENVLHSYHLKVRNRFVIFVWGECVCLYRLSI